MIRRRALLCALTCAFTGTLATSARADAVVLVTDVDAKPAQDARDALVADDNQVELVTLANARARLADGAQTGRSDLVWLAAGVESARALAATSIAHRAALLVRAAEVPAGIATVALDVEPAQQLAWIARAFPGRTRVLVLRDPAAHSLDDAAALAAAKSAGLSLVLVDVRAQGETVPALATALRAPGAPAIVWVVPDKTAITGDTLAPLTQAALSARVPLVGFSPYFLRVGALGAIVVEPSDSARQAFALAVTPSAAGAPASTAKVHVETAKGARLVIDGRLAQRLGVPVKSGPGVEVRK